jgi:hypothetical protein
MRPNTAIAERQGDLGGEKVQMTFDQNSLAHLMTVLTDLYSDPETAVIREYSTNALDAQKRAGVSRPIEVTTPNQLAPFFKVKDYGIGMNATDIRDIYSQYGASTKRDSDDQVGMLGLGCKSALTYTNSFTVSAVKDNVKTLVVVSRSEDGSGIMEILSEAASEEPNGVEIIIPVKSRNSFDYKSKQFFRFWEEGTVLLNGSPVEQISGRAVSDSMIVVPGLNDDYVVMGNVPYIITTPHFITLDRHGRNGVVARVPIGDVSFTPSREALHYTLRTKETLKRLQSEYTEGLKNVLKRDIDAAETSIDAAKVYFEWSKILYGSLHRAPKFKYNGKEIFTSAKCKNFLYKMSSSRYAVQEGTYLHLDTLLQFPVIHGFTGTKVSSHQREKIRMWSDSVGITTNDVILVNVIPDEYQEWLGNDNLYSWEDVKAIKKDRPKSVRREEVEYEVFREKTGQRESLTKKDFPANVVKILATPAELRDADYRWFRSFGETFPDAMIVRIPTTRWDKFRRDFSDTTTLREFITEKAKQASLLLTEEDKIYMSIDWTARRFLPLLDDSAIDDKKLATFIKVTRQKTESPQLKAFNHIDSLGALIHIPRTSIPRDIYNPFVSYPLLSGQDNGRNAATQHAVMYVNAVYNSQ